VTVFVPHTTAGVTINEAADPAVAADILKGLDSLVPWEAGWRHAEGNAGREPRRAITAPLKLGVG